MALRHPLETWPNVRRRRLFLALLVGTVVVGLPLLWAESHLVTDEAPFGIISYSLSGDESLSMLWSWSYIGTVGVAAFAVGYEFLFIPFYTTLFAAVSVGMSLRCRSRGLVGLASLGALLGWAAWAVAAVDAVENAAMLGSILRPHAWSWPPDTAMYAATTKFTVLGVVLVYAAVAGVLTWLRPRRPVPDGATI